MVANIMSIWALCGSTVTGVTPATDGGEADLDEGGDFILSVFDSVLKPEFEPDLDPEPEPDLDPDLESLGCSFLFRSETLIGGTFP